MSNQATTNDLSALIDRYIAIWNETDPVARRTLIDATWAKDATYRDPLLTGTGRDGIDEMTAGFQQARPGHTFELTSEHPHDEGAHRFDWRLLSPTGEVMVVGSDAYELDANGRLQTIVGAFQ